MWKQQLRRPTLSTGCANTASDFRISTVDLHGNVRSPSSAAQLTTCLAFKSASESLSLSEGGIERLRHQYHRVPSWRGKTTVAPQRSNIASSVPPPRRHQTPNSSHRAGVRWRYEQDSGSEMRGAGEIGELRIRSRGYLPHWEAPGASLHLPQPQDSRLPTFSPNSPPARAQQACQKNGEKMSSTSTVARCVLSKDPRIAIHGPRRLVPLQRTTLPALGVVRDAQPVHAFPYIEYKLSGTPLVKSHRPQSQRPAPAGAFWQHESYNRIVRVEREYETFMATLAIIPAKPFCKTAWAATKVTTAPAPQDTKNPVS